jgi:biotin operon repressor
MDSSSPSIADLARLLKVIADETRLRILGAIAERPLTGKELAARLSLTPPTISHHMRKLTEAGVVVAESDAQKQIYSLNKDLLLASRRAPLHESTVIPKDDGEGEGIDPDDAFRAKTIRDFFDGERLKTVPAQRKRRVIILQHLVERFDSDQTYSEREVNDFLRSAHDDVATLRRELVDYGFMQRERGIYQVTRGAPERSFQVRQEITGDESAWFRALLANAIRVESSDR